MTESENFLERWSKRKLAKDEPAAPERNETSPRAEDEAGASAPVLKSMPR